MKMLANVQYIIVPSRLNEYPSGSTKEEIRGLEADLSDVSELTPVLAALAALGDRPSRLRGRCRTREESNIGSKGVRSAAWLVPASPPWCGASSATAARAAQNDIDFKTADIDHVSIQVTDLQRSVDFYKKMFDFSIVSEDKPLGIIRLGTNRTLVSLNRQSPAKIVDHFAIGVPRFTKEAATRYLTQRGGRVGDDPYHGLHVTDPDGIYVQISLQR